MGGLARYLVGDALQVLTTLPTGSVDLVVTSPPFWALRAYLPDDSPLREQEMGGETDPGAFLDALLDVIVECRRILAPHGSLCVELGDTSADSGGAGGDYDPGGMRAGQRRWRQAPRTENTPLPKSLCMIPELLRVALVYGQNPLTGRELDRWIVRNVVRWCRTNPSVGRLSDSYRRATSDLVVACTSPTRWFDLDAVRIPARQNPIARPGHGMESMLPAGDTETAETRPVTVPPLDWWNIPTQAFRGTHHASFPEALCVTPILSMCPPKVCTVCGDPSRRIAVTTNRLGRAVVRASWRDGGYDGASRHGATSAAAPSHADRETLGWTHCRCGDGCEPTTWTTQVTEVEQGQQQDGRWVDLADWADTVPPAHTRISRKRRRIVNQLGACHDGSHWRAGIVLDPFAGTGTVGQVATGHGRDFIGIDLDPANTKLARSRVGDLFLTVQNSETGAA